MTKITCETDYKKINELQKKLDEGKKLSDNEKLFMVSMTQKNINALYKQINK